MKNSHKKLFLRALKLGGVYRIFRRIHRKSCVILMYHGVMREKIGVRLFNHAGMQLAIEKFEEQMKFMRQFYRLISLEEWLESRKNGADTGRGNAVITFDDGYENNYTEGFPILKRYSIPATVFLSTGYVGTDNIFWSDRLEKLFSCDHCFSRLSATFKLFQGDPKTKLEAVISYCKNIPEEEKEEFIARLEKVCPHTRHDIPADYQALTWGQAREMYDSGLIAFGSHTHSHVIMTRVNRERARADVAISKAILRDNLGKDTRLFSYPNGGIGDFDQSTHGILREEGFECALLTVDGLNRRSTNIFELRRVGIHNDMSLLEFEARVSGAYRIVQAIAKERKRPWGKH